MHSVECPPITRTVLADDLLDTRRGNPRQVTLRAEVFARDDGVVQVIGPDPFELQHARAAGLEVIDTQRVRPKLKEDPFAGLGDRPVQPVVVDQDLAIEREAGAVVGSKHERVLARLINEQLGGHMGDIRQRNAAKIIGVGIDRIAKLIEIRRLVRRDLGDLLEIPIDGIHTEGHTRIGLLGLSDRGMQGERGNDDGGFTKQFHGLMVPETRLDVVGIAPKIKSQTKGLDPCLGFDILSP